MFRKLLIALCSFLPAACFFGGPPSGLALQTGAHPSTPVLVQVLAINGRNLQNMEDVVTGGWANPKGDGMALLSMPLDENDKSRLHIAARWVDLGQNVTYTAEILAQMSDLTVERKARPTGHVIVLFGPGGYLELATSAPPDASGQYNGRIIATTCGTRDTDALPDDHWVWQDERFIQVKDDPTPAPNTGCPK